MKEFEEVKIDMNHAFSGCYERNRLCLDDYEFAVVEGAMWKGSYARQFKNKPKPEINKIFSAINRLLGQKQRLEMNAKIISNSDDATDEDADLLQSRWRNDFQSSDGVEAINNSDQEAFFSGFGAFKVVAKYEDEENPNPEKQYLCVEPIMSAASSVVFSPSLRKDKADAKQCWQVIRTNRREIEKEYGETVSSVNGQIDWFDWNTDTEKDIYLAHYYEVVTKKLTDYDFDGYVVTAGDGIKDNRGNKITREDLDLLKEHNPDYSVTRRTVKRVEYALMSGSGFLTKPQKTPFKRIPIFPQYGYHAVINGIEYYCGEVRKRRDPQMFFNTYYSSLMEIMAASQVEKPEYTPEQIARHAGQRARADIDNVPFVLSDPIKDKSGNIAHLGPIGKQMPPQIGTGLAAAGQELKNSLFEMSGTGQSTVPSNASADAIQQVNERQDDSFQPLMQNSIAAIKSACECWIDAAKALYFSNERSIRVQAQDGSYSQVRTVQYSMNENGEYGPFKNAARGKYSVQVKIGESFKNKKEAELETTLKMLQYTDASTPQGQMLLNQAIMATTGEGGSDARRVARFQMIDSMLSMGIDPEPKTDEEKEYIIRKMKQAQQQMGQPDPQTVLALSEAKAREDEGRAAIMNEQNDATKNQIEIEKLRLRDKELNIKAAEAGVKIENTQADTIGKRIDNAQKVFGGANV